MKQKEIPTVFPCADQQGVIHKVRKHFLKGKGQKIEEKVMKDRSKKVMAYGKGAHSANFDKKVHKPQNKSYDRIDTNMQLIFMHTPTLWLTLLWVLRKSRVKQNLC